MESVARLVLRSGGGSLHFNITSRFLIGRRCDCDLPLIDPLVSRCHAVIELNGTRAQVEDLASRNGTRLNGKLITKNTIEHGDTLQICRQTFVFEWIRSQSLHDEEATPSFDKHFPVREPAITDAERLVLIHLLAGHSEKFAAAKLHLSQHTVHNHVRRIYSAHGVNSRAELLAKYITFTDTQNHNWRDGP